MKSKAEKFPAMQTELWPLNRIKPYERNPRTHPEAQIELLAKLLLKRGIDQPIVVDDKGVILKGHGRLEAARRAGLTQFPVIVRKGLSDTDKVAMRIEDNAVSLLSGWSTELLQIEVGQLKIDGYDIPMLGFSETQLTSFMTVPLVSPPEDVIPAIPKKPITKPGDIWILGRHRIMCGDCRKDTDVKKLLAGSLINVAFTSPPYAEQRDYDESSGFKPIPPDEYVKWFAPVAARVGEHLAKDGSWFVNIKPSAGGLDTDLYVFDLVIAHVREWGWHFATEFCWERNGVPKSVTHRFKNQFEPIYQFALADWKMRPRSVMHNSGNVPIPGGPGSGQTSWKSGQGGRGEASVLGSFGAAKKRRGLDVGPTTASRLQVLAGAYAEDVKKRKRGFPTGESSQGTDWQKGAPLGVPLEDIGDGMAYPGNRLQTFAMSHTALGHAAAFPVGLPDFFAKAYSDEGDVIYDPFMGSGSTLIAAEQSDRIGMGTEISPGYVDVIVERWQNVTGRKAKRARR